MSTSPAERQRAEPPRRLAGPAVQLLGLLVLLAFGILALERVDRAALRRALSGAEVWPLVLATAGNFGAIALQAARWRALVQPAAPRVRYRDAWLSLNAGYAVGLALPARTNDVVRIHLLARRSGASMAALAGTAAIDHLVGGVTLLALLVAAPLLAPLPRWASHAALGALGALAAGGLAIWLLRPRGRGAPSHGGLSGFVGRLRHGLLAAETPAALARSAAFALGSWGAELVIALLALRAFHLPTTPETALLCVLATTLSAAASVSPGNAGAFELSAVLALASLGVAHAPALAFALGYHLVHLLPVAVAGGGWLLLSQARRALPGGAR
ncbi:lysylphosphatidylglycerol synthase transmembrane domain-containing protein [Anaeromyxobacter paludicola]|uniref:Flippase-like domain-containing protein n=1 Tax=Anaeromyxobacter paludicola TaxID=2918171 RepID=A0ABN6N2E2_9BACT|nr:lysylphosphatidylglycerol synthase transmembrane domain-containing protein [Anaeromyxobacter paludicola]BDG07221.1 hypothetical protein AMPC_03340 [Anaeromyxobacter paludicola]